MSQYPGRYALGALRVLLTMVLLVLVVVDPLRAV